MLHPSPRNCNWKVSFPLLYSWQKPWEEALILCRNTAHSKLTVLHRRTRAVDKPRQHREHPTRCRTPSPTGRAWTLPRVQNPPSLDEQRGGALDHLKKIRNLLSLESNHFKKLFYACWLWALQEITIWHLWLSQYLGENYRTSFISDKFYSRSFFHLPIRRGYIVKCQSTVYFSFVN